MNGLGNDFVIIDARASADFALNDEQIRHISARDNAQTGGCDQLLIVRAPLDSSKSDVFMEIRNNDGGEVGACGNGTRAVGAYLHRYDGQMTHKIATHGAQGTQGTQGEVITTQIDKDNQACIVAQMPPPHFAWADIPLAHKGDTGAIILDPALPPAFMVNVGNPHAVIFVADNPARYAKEYGAALETHALFPQKANINFALLEDEQTIRLHTWERGVGLTQACGTGAYATAVAAIMLGKTTAQQITIRPPRYSEATPDNYIYVDYTNRNAPLVRGCVQFDYEGEVQLCL